MTTGENGARPTACAVHLQDVEFSWPRDQFTLSVEHFSIDVGEKILLLGESGSGKSTLLSLICGVTVPQKGQVCVAGREMTALRPAQRDRVRADKIGVIFQVFNLLPYASALDNILVPLRFSTERKHRCPQPREDALGLCQALGLPRELIVNGAASALSVGQQQRVAVARAMIGNPDLIIADEPTSALDAASQGEFLDLLFHQVDSTGSTLIMVSHDERLAGRFDRVLRLGDVATTRRATAA